MRLTITTFLSLDGVMQAPGGPNEDRSGGFEQGGWLVPYADEDMGKIMTDWFANADGFLLGRRTYEIFAAHWPHIGEDDPVAAKLNSLPKYVVTTTLNQAQWHNTTLVKGDVPGQVATLKEQPGREIQLHGSGELAQTLMQHNLIDSYRLWIYPVVLGNGKRLFRTSLPFSLKPIDSQTTGTGVAVHSYEPAGQVAYGSFELEH